MHDIKRYLVTSALPYANGPLHLGHLAGAYLASDTYVRFLRLMDKDVVHICGSDEYGAAITLRAAKDGKPPQAIVDHYHALFVKAFNSIGVCFDIYHRTTEKIHSDTSQEFFRNMYKQGEFIEKETEQYFDEEAGQFLADRYISGTCPRCSNDGAYGDQCESCGSSLSPTELINPKSTLSGSKPVMKKTTHWYLPLDKYEDWLREWINEGTVDGKELHDPSTWKKHVLGQCKSWLDSGLLPRSMTRDLDWGIDVPPEIEGSEGKKLYVWMDAPIGYISATKQWALDNGKDWEPYWKSEDTALIHFIGKDNIVFHCLIFPAILKAHGGYILPKNVPANQFLNLEGRKLSTSKNWAVWVNDYIEDLPGKEDELRYHMIKNMPEQKDSEFTWKGYQDSVNNELVNNLANFINRVMVLTNKYYDGEVPDFDENEPFTAVSSHELGDEGWFETEYLQLFDDLHDLCQDLRTYEFRSALKRLMVFSAKGNQLLQFNEPWKRIKENPENVKVVMNLALQIVAAISVVCQPFLPFTAHKLRKMLNLPKLENGALVQLLDLMALGDPILPTGHKINQGEHLFSRIDDAIIQAQLDKLAATDKANNPVAVPAANGQKPKETISFDDFSKVDIRTATILKAEKVPKADKLLKLELDLGTEERQVVSGIAQFYNSDDIVGKKVLLLANLAPRKIRGIESQGMILMAEDASGELAFVSPEKSINNGSTVK